MKECLGDTNGSMTIIGCEIAAIDGNECVDDGVCMFDNGSSNKIVNIIDVEQFLAMCDMALISCDVRIIVAANEINTMMTIDSTNQRRERTMVGCEVNWKKKCF